MVLAGIVKRLVQIVVVLILEALLLFGASGQIGWIWAWIFLGISVLSIIFNSILLVKKNPGMVAERGNSKLIMGWDKIVATLYTLSLFACVPLVAGLDNRFGWTYNLSEVWNVAGAVGLASALAFASWAMLVNSFFSTTVRIQTDRGHTVCSTGPYRFVRHPGYLGFIAQCLATPILLGSVWAMWPAMAAAIALVIRTSYEDRTLQQELPGYTGYVREVRYRLLPGIW
jgi:protein-S-isoprenylcysteine O-methyltransferase Ste14